jgi:hypothetical protein
MPRKGSTKRATRTNRRLQDQIRKTADEMWANYDLNWWWEFDPIRFAPPRARPYLENARRSFLLATRELLDSYIEWSSTTTPTRRSTRTARSRKVPIKR